MSETDNGQKFGTTWLKPPVIVPIGGRWAYAVGIVTNKKGEKPKLRIIKGKLDKTKPGGISQVQRLNFKTRKQWQDVAAQVECAFKTLDDIQEEGDDIS